MTLAGSLDKTLVNQKTKTRLEVCNQFNEQLNAIPLNFRRSALLAATMPELRNSLIRKRPTLFFPKSLNGF